MVTLLKYTNGSVTVEAVQWRGLNHLLVCEFAKSVLSNIPVGSFGPITLTDKTKVLLGDFIVKDEEGTFFAMGKSEFMANWEQVPPVKHRKAAFRLTVHRDRPDHKVSN